MEQEGHPVVPVADDSQVKIHSAHSPLIAVALEQDAEQLSCYPFQVVVLETARWILNCKFFHEIQWNDEVTFWILILNKEIGQWISEKDKENAHWIYTEPSEVVIIRFFFQSQK